MNKWRSAVISMAIPTCPDLKPGMRVNISHHVDSSVHHLLSDVSVYKAWKPGESPASAHLVLSIALKDFSPFSAESLEEMNSNPLTRFIFRAVGCKS